MSRNVLLDFVNPSKKFVDSITERLQVESVILDDWGNAYRLVYDINISDDAAKKILGTDIYNTKKYQIENPKARKKFSTKLCKPSKEQKSIFDFEVSSKFLNVKSIDEYKKCFIHWIVQCKTKKSLRDELKLVKNFILIHYKDVAKSDIKKREDIIKSEILKEARLKIDKKNLKLFDTCLIELGLDRLLSMKIIIDTNIWMSFIIGKTILKLKDIIEQNNFEIIITDEIINEINRASQYPRFSKYFKEQEKEVFLKYLASISSNIELKSKVDICRDEKDNYLLALAQDTEADYIVTGDKDLLVLNKFGKTEIIRFAKFTELFQLKK